MTIHCRIADAAETVICRALIPAAAALPAEWLVAFDSDADDSAAILGAAALVWRNSSWGPGFPLWVEVVPPQRRRGIGRALVEAATGLGRGETAGLWVLQPLAPGTPAAEFVQSCGFFGRSQTFYFDVELPAIMPTLAAKAARARSGGGLAVAVAVAPLVPAHVEAVAMLVSAALGEPLTSVRAEVLRLAGDAASGSTSVVAQLDGQVIACILSRAVTDPQTGEIVGIVDAAVVAPAQRGAHLSQIMMVEVVQNMLVAGITRGRFQSEDHVVSTFDVAQRISAGPVPSSVRFYRPLGTAGSKAGGAD
jgi:GNAT superfamily N-acetyltransferase